MQRCDPHKIERYWTEAQNVENDLQDLLLPWLRKSKEEKQREDGAAAGGLLGIWEAYYGKMDDPATEAAIQATVRALDASYARAA